VAACRFLAAACERALVAEGRCAEADLDAEARADIRRRVAERCLAGVDENPVAVELARLSVWLTTLAMGKPLGFLDHRLRVGNSLLGASPDDLHRLSSGRRRPARRADLPLFERLDLEASMSAASLPLADLLARRDDSADAVRAKERLWRRAAGAASPVERWRQACHVWCSQWLWPTDGGPRPSAAEFRAAIDAIVGGDRTLPVEPLRRLVATANRVSQRRRLFHWPIEFADVFHGAGGAVDAGAGFDAIVGNPPWEMVRRDPRGSSSRDARESDARLVDFVRGSGLYPSCRRGHVNLYQPFLDRALALARPGGRIGLVMPWGLASDDGAADLRATLVERHGIDTIVGLDNGRGLFPIHRGLRFLVVVIRAGGRTDEVRARFGVRTADELDDLPGRDDPLRSAYPVRLTPGGLSAVGGRTRRIPDVRRAIDHEVARRAAREFPRLGDPSGWGARFGRELNATEDRHRFTPRGWPVIEGKHVSPFVVEPAGAPHRIEPDAAARALGPGRADRARLAYRDVSGVGNRLSLIAAIVPAGVVTTHTLYCLRTPLPLVQQHGLAAFFNSFVLNAIVRLLMGQHVTTGLVEDLPVPRWTGDRADRYLAGLARSIARRRGPAREAALQAAVARRYGLTREAFAELLAGFPLVSPDERQRAIDALSRAPVAL
jgi:hypothetical protein